MKKISWQLVVIIAMVLGCVTALELYALSKGIDGVLLAAAVAAMIGIPSILITRKVTKKNGDKDA